jgi:hypothetical protein
MAKKKAASRRAAPKAKKSLKKAGKKKASRNSPAPKKTASQPTTLGRPKVTNEELLYMLFKEDFHARQVFEFLRVNTLKELEQFSASDIIRRLSQPVRETVERIRHTLARYNRCLANDMEYALERKAERSGQ